VTNFGKWKSQNDKYQRNAVIIDGRTEDFTVHEENGPVTSILISGIIVMGSRVKFVAEASAYRI